MLKLLVNIAIGLALGTIVLGAYTRLTEAGLGCPDWPGCYGFIAVPEQAAQLAQAQNRYPQAKVEPNKAHNEMHHRYLAGLLGLCVLAIFVLSQWQKKMRSLSSIIFTLVIMQAALGMWTVTLNLLPMVVLGHLLGGFGLFSSLVLLRLQLAPNMIVEPEPQLNVFRVFCWLVLAILVMQICLGAWTSSNYAALACHQLPFCEPGWEQRFDAASAFSLPLGKSTYQYGVLPHDARLSIHVLHRAGALVTLIFLGSFSYFVWRCTRNKILQKLALGIAALLILQISLGAINVLAYLPLMNALAHNLVAANLFMLLVVFLHQLYQVRKSN